MVMEHPLHPHNLVDMGVKINTRQSNHLRFTDDTDPHNTKPQPRGANVDRFRQRPWKDWSSTKLDKNDVHKERMAAECPTHAQRNENLRILQLRLSRS
ncbi:hypothetical protein KIN20_032424 [Parelaphostrongylus tenuis]|uniref:Uncharacterized protein n=1 Tax=Parelaphostrongylus tenuis TaxID=148309 RepID=A0AAD5R6K4_PARTN|nr:hypothetical protein KIN20_032424 [Parelaphostrongylus tenuis]